MQFEIVLQRGDACLHIIPVLGQDIEIKEYLKAIFSHHRAKQRLSYFGALFFETSRDFIIFLLLVEELPVSYQVSFTNRRCRDRKIWRNIQVNSGSSTSSGSRRRRAFVFVIRHVVFDQCSICGAKLAFSRMRLTTTISECFSLSALKLYCYLSVYFLRKMLSHFWHHVKTSQYQTMYVWQLQFNTKYRHYKSTQSSNGYHNRNTWSVTTLTVMVWWESVWISLSTLGRLVSKVVL